MDEGQRFSRIEMVDAHVIETKFDITLQLGEVLDNLLRDDIGAFSGNWNIHSTKRVVLDQQKYITNQYHNQIRQAEDILDRAQTRSIPVAPRLDTIDIPASALHRDVPMKRIFLTPRTPAHFDAVVRSLNVIPTLANRHDNPDIHHRAYVDVIADEVKTGEAWDEARQEFINQIGSARVVGLYALSAVGITGRNIRVPINLLQLDDGDEATHSSTYLPPR